VTFSVRLYGSLSGSYKTVSEGMRGALGRAGILAGFVPGGDLGFSNEESPGVEAPVSVVVGDPFRALAPHLQGKHKSSWVLIAPNSEGIPPQIVEFLLGDFQGRRVAQGILAPSHWAEGVLRNMFPKEVPVVLWQHGVSSAFDVNQANRQMAMQNYSSREFQLLHVTSTKLSRKGTLELLRAWKQFLVQCGSGWKMRLDMLVNPRQVMDYADMIKREKALGVLVVPGQGFTEKRYVEGLSRYHGIVQPSRAEGFGLVPLETRACGIPVLATAVTGHADHHVGPGAVRIPVGEFGPSDDFSGARAVLVHPEDILEGLKTFRDNWSEHSIAALDAAQAVRSEWSWDVKSAEAVERLGMHL
jgi:glycosyltransferase involved in cell wall biosynthesis